MDGYSRNPARMRTSCRRTLPNVSTPGYSSAGAGASNVC